MIGEQSSLEGVDDVSTGSGKALLSFGISLGLTTCNCDLEQINPL